MNNIREKINSLNLNVRQHQIQIQALYKEIQNLEELGNNSNNNSNNSNNNSINNLCISEDIKLSKKNENVDKFL